MQCDAIQSFYEQMKQNWVRTGIWSFLSFSFSWCITKPVEIVLLRKLDKDIFELRGDLQHNNSLRVYWLALTSSLEHAASVKFQANHWLSVGSVEKKMRTSSEDSRVSDIWDSRKMMSSVQTETEVFGLLPKKQHRSIELPRLYHFCFLIFNPVGGEWGGGHHALHCFLHTAITDICSPM